MTMTEFFIEPLGSDERYELNGESAVDAFFRLCKITDVLVYPGKIDNASAELQFLPAGIVWVLIDGLGGAKKWRQSAPGSDGEVSEQELKDAVLKWPLHNVTYFDV